MTGSCDWNFVLQIVGIGIAVVLIVVILWSVYKMFARKGMWKKMMPTCMMDGDCGQAKLLIIRQQTMVDTLQNEIAVNGNQKVQQELDAAQRGLEDAKEMKDDVDTLRAKYMECQNSLDSTPELKDQIRAMEDQLQRLRTERNNFQSSYNELKASVEAKGVAVPSNADAAALAGGNAIQSEPAPQAAPQPVTAAMQQLNELEAMAAASLPPVAPNAPPL